MVRPSLFEAGYPDWIVWLLPFPFAFGPLFFGYILRTVQPGRKLGYKGLLHFGPFLAAWTAPLLPPNLIRPPAISMTITLLAGISAGAYLFTSHQLIQRFYQKQQFNENDRYRYQWRWLDRLARMLGLSLLLWAAQALSGYFMPHFALNKPFHNLLSILTAAALIRTGAVAFFHSINHTPAETPPTIKKSSAIALKQKGNWLKKKIEAGFLYQDAELSVSSLAEQLDMPAHELSRIINIALKKNFSDLVNEYRVRDIISKMQDPAYDHLTLLGIAFESGFSSKTTFNRAFKEMTGKSPAEYKKGLKKERPFSEMERLPRNRPVVLQREPAFQRPIVKTNPMTIFHNYLKIARRNILRNISYSSINMIGLAAGLSSFIVILLYMNYELSYDKWSPELNKVYHVSLREHEDYLSTTPAPLAAFLGQSYPNVAAATSLQADGDFELLIAAGENKVYQKNVLTVDSNFFRVFPYQLDEGDIKTALNAPNAVILTGPLSRQLFGKQDPIGRTVKFYNAFDLVVTGILKDQPGATHLPVGMLMRDHYAKSNNFWGNYSFQTYVKLKQPETDANIETAINRLYYNERLKHGGVSFETYTKAGAATNLFVDQVPRIHNFPKHGSSNFATVTILLVLAILLLLAGAINFSNLAIAQSIGRAREVGIRKVMGSGRVQLVIQFMVETALQCLVSLILAIILLAVAMPYINNSFDIKLGFLQPNEMFRVILQLLACLVAIILLSGAYPSVYLSKFNAIKVLKGNYSTGNKGTLFRNSLIVVQFMVSVFFIAGIIVIKSQLGFMKSRDRGFSGDQLVRIQAAQNTREQGFDHARELLLTVPGVTSVAKTTSVPGDNLFADTSTIAFKNNGKSFRMQSVKVSTDYFTALRVPLIKGRLFRNDVQDQATRSAVINEQAARKLQLADPVGAIINFPGCDSIPVRIVGIVKDFNVHGYESDIQPVVYTIGNQACMYQSGGAMLVRLNSGHARESLAGITQVWKKLEPAFPIRYSFVDQNFEQLFISYVRLEKIITFFGLIAIMISAMGLFALTAFFTRQRVKEIGVRKVLGATVPQLTALLSRDFIYLVLLAVLIITPFTWWMAQKWLQNFAYRVDIGWWMFVAAGTAAIIVAVLTVSFQALKTALANPADSLRNE